MQDIYRMMEERSSREFAPEGEFDKQAWAERKQSERQEAFDRADAAALRANSDPAALETYMRVAAQLPHHSATNILLIADRIPNATRVGTAEHWRRQGASVRRGQKAIPIIEPVKEYVRDDGSIGVLYDVRKVFDVSQTTARPCLPRRVDPHAALAALVARSPTRIEPVDDLGGVPAEYDHASGIAARRLGLECSGAVAAPAPPEASAREVRDALGEIGKAARDVSERMAPPERRRDRSEGR